MSYKFYVCEFRNKKYPIPDDRVLVKFGITRHMDVLKRFDPSVNDGYEKNYSDWDIVCKFSQLCLTKEEAEQKETYWLNEKYPKGSKYKVWVESLFGLPHTYYSNNTGVSELRLLTKKEASWLYWHLHRQKELHNAQ